MKILLAVDDDTASYEAALVVADWFTDDASVVALHVGPAAPPTTPMSPMTAGSVGYPVFTLPSMRTRQREIFDEAREVAERAARVTDGAVRTEVGDPAEMIVQVAEEIDADLIVVGTGDRTWLSRLIHPSVGSDVAGRAPCSVLVVRPGTIAAGNER